MGNMSRLLKLYLDGTAVEDLSLSMEQLIGFIKLDLTNYKSLSSLLGAISSLTSLKTLTLSDCLKLDNMPRNLGNLEGLEELDVSGTAVREPPSSIFCLKNLKILSFQGCNGLSSKSWSWKNLLMRKTPYLIGLVLLSVLGLCSLTKLNIRNCNLQSIPSDIGCLFTLEKLDLSGPGYFLINKFFHDHDLDNSPLHPWKDSILRFFKQKTEEGGSVIAVSLTSSFSKPSRFSKFLDILSSFKQPDRVCF